MKILHFILLSIGLIVALPVLSIVLALTLATFAPGIGLVSPIFVELMLVLILFTVVINYSSK